MNDKSTMKTEAENVSDILSAIHEFKATIIQLNRENSDLKIRMNQILTDPNYKGGLQYWITKHDNQLQMYLKAVSPHEPHNPTTDNRRG